VLAGLVLADHLAHLHADRPDAAEPAGPDPGEDRVEELLGGGEKFFAGAGAVGGQGRVSAGDGDEQILADDDLFTFAVRLSGRCIASG
jgi:hypothetical protein